ncbi:MAG: YdbC family protein [Pseudobdellovibrionaceae bacterium]|nr:MAG: YdbC family protein [Pseudobdellovibrionaceae bacterium]
MLIKWIVCKVIPEHRTSFSKAQEAWQELSDVDGFIAQFGGWDLKNSGDACILGLWKDKESYDQFMNHVHDNVFETNSQENTYESISVGLFDTVLDMPGLHSNLVTSLCDGKYLRVADCKVKPDHVDHFVAVQREIWIPEMAKAKGMIGGNFNRSPCEDRFIVTTLWTEQKLHDEYSKNIVPSLREKANVSNDLIHMTGRFVLLEPTWEVN